MAVERDMDSIQGVLLWSVGSVQSVSVQSDAPETTRNAISAQVEKPLFLWLSILIPLEIQSVVEIGIKIPSQGLIISTMIPILSNSKDVWIIVLDAPQTPAAIFVSPILTNSEMARVWVVNILFFSSRKKENADTGVQAQVSTILAVLPVWTVLGTMIKSMLQTPLSVKLAQNMNSSWFKKIRTW